MNEATFWEIVARTQNPNRQLSLMAEEMQKLSADDILAFQRTFNALHSRAYTWDLWGAAYVINGGASDDGFDYFRSWVISRGQKTYELALKHADDLADVRPADEDGEPVEFEVFMDPALNAWAHKTGKDWNAYYAAIQQLSKCDAQRASEPSGTPFREDDLAKQYPKLWKRFGEHPRG